MKTSDIAGKQKWAKSSGYDEGIARHEENLRAARAGEEIHHFATNKNKRYTPDFQAIADSYGLELDGSWNKMLLPHRGRHTNVYHEFVLDGMARADRTARGNVSVFLQEFNRNVINPVIADPRILYK